MVFVATPCLTGLRIKLIHSMLQSVQAENNARNFDGFCSHTLSQVVYLVDSLSVTISSGGNSARSFDGFCSFTLSHGLCIQLIIIIIMYIYHALINALSAHVIHMNLHMVFCTHVEHSPTKTIYIKVL